MAPGSAHASLTGPLEDRDAACWTGPRGVPRAQRLCLRRAPGQARVAPERTVLWHRGPPALWTPGEPVWGRSPASPGRELSRAQAACVRASLRVHPTLRQGLPAQEQGPPGRLGPYLPGPDCGTTGLGLCVPDAWAPHSPFSSTTSVPAGVAAGTVLGHRPPPTGRWPAQPDHVGVSQSG